MITAALALQIAAHGFSVLPIELGSKKSTVVWSQYQLERMPDEIIKREFTGRTELAIICGGASHGLEVIDFDTFGGRCEHFGEWWNTLKENGYEDLTKKLVVAKTPSGGYHVYYRCPDHIEGNKKLASKKKTEGYGCIIETRGNGGYVLAPPSTGYEFKQGQLGDVCEITKDERDMLMVAARMMNETEEVEVYRQERISGYFGDSEERPGDRFNNNARIEDILEPLGWKYLRTKGQNQHWRRPGKADKGLSATFHESKRVFYNFSGDAYPLIECKGYSPFSLLVALKYGGSVTNCARDLAVEFGMIKKHQPKESKPVRNHTAEELDELFDAPLAETFEPETAQFGIFGRYFQTRQINLLDAPGGIGKTTFLLKVAASGSHGIDLATEEPIDPFHTMLFTTEDTGGSVRQVWESFSPVPGSLRIIDKVLDLRGDVLDKLEQTIQKHGTRLVIFDPLLTYMHGVSNVNDPKAVNEYLVGLRQIAMRNDVAIVNIRHFAKGANLKDITERGAGTNQFRDSHRSQVVMAKHPEQDNVRVLFHTKWSLTSGGECPPIGFENHKYYGFMVIQAKDLNLEAFNK